MRAAAGAAELERDMLKRVDGSNRQLRPGVTVRAPFEEAGQEAAMLDVVLIPLFLFGGLLLWGFIRFTRWMWQEDDLKEWG